jgi:hypothetical protein
MNSKQKSALVLFSLLKGDENMLNHLEDKYDKKYVWRKGGINAIFQIVLPTRHEEESKFHRSENIGNEKQVSTLGLSFLMYIYI